MKIKDNEERKKERKKEKREQKNKNKYGRHLHFT
jgi:hypothetical protein